MNILFLISNDGGNGVGGHYHSLNQLSLEVSKQHNVQIVVFGSATSPVLEDNPAFIKHIKVGTGLAGLIKANRELTKLRSGFTPDLIHCFDTQSLNRALLLPVYYNLPVVLNKCGGKNPLRSNYQHADAIVTFSIENRDWFTENRNYNKEDIFLIPNRVSRLIPLEPSLRIEQKEADKITFVRISRLGGAYEKTLLDTFNLIEKLSEKYPVQLIVIGRIQDNDRFEKLVEAGREKNIPVKYITDERATKGSDFLYLADFVIGTGRSLMEATSLGLPTLTPAVNSNFPVLLNSSNLETFLRTNFSERNIADEVSLKNNLASLEELMNNGDKYKEAQAETLAIFNDYFGTDSILPKYNLVYNYAIKKSRTRIKLIFKNLEYIIKFILGK
jgi:glycosyltransferase involved in cell wall biosynthesis